MHPFIHPLLLLLISLIGLLPLAAQNSQIEKLEEERKKALQEIRTINSQISKTSKSTTQTITRLKVMESEINVRKVFINRLNQQIKSLDGQQDSLQHIVTELETTLQSQKKDFTDALQKMHRKKSQVNQLLFIFSANDIYQAIRRARYLKEFAVWQRLKGEEIQERQRELNRELRNLYSKKNETNQVKRKTEKDRSELETQEGDLKKEYTSLTSKNKQLRIELTKQQQTEKRIKGQIQKIIEAEARRLAEEAEKKRRAAEKQRQAAEEAARRKQKEQKTQANTSTNTSTSQRKEEKREEALKSPDVELPLSREFTANKGRLPAPITSHFRISGKFGEQPHPYHKQVRVYNNGIDLQAVGRAEARAVFDGVVSVVFAVQGSNSSVIVRHGNYMTVYSNLSKVYVTKGQEVSAKQSLGVVFEENGTSTLHFQMYKETTKLNPAPWIVGL